MTHHPLMVVSSCELLLLLLVLSRLHSWWCPLYDTPLTPHKADSHSPPISYAQIQHISRAYWHLTPNYCYCYCYCYYLIKPTYYSTYSGDSLLTHHAACSMCHVPACYHMLPQAHHRHQASTEYTPTVCSHLHLI